MYKRQCDKSRFIWSNSDAAVFLEEIASLEQLVGGIDCVIAGHSGIPFERQIGRVSWVNAGVIGMPPHDGRAETRFAVLGSDGMRIHKLSYDFETAARSMEAVGLVQGYETALRCGYWPSEDILPHDLRRQAEPA